MGEPMRLGKVVLFVVVVVVVLFVGMFYVPTVNSAWTGIDTTGFSDFLKAGAAFMPFAFIGFILYLIYNAKFGNR